MNIAVILAGGTGNRVGAGIPKQFIKVHDKPILAYTLELFQNNPNIDAIEVVCHKDWLEEVDRIKNEYSINKTNWITLGGSTFEESTMNGVFNLKGKINEDDIVVISFGVAPMTTDEEINDSIRVAKEHGNGISAAKMDLLLCDMQDEYCSTTFLDRENIRGFSNPWSFRYGELLEVYAEAAEKELIGKVEPHITSLYFALGRTVWFSKSDRRDIKITYKEDLDTFEAFLLLKAMRDKANKNLNNTDFEEMMKL